MKIIYFIIEKDSKKSLDEKTKKSIESKNALMIQDELDILKTDLKDYTHAIILPNGSELSENYLDIVNVYYKENAIMLPLVLLKTEKLNGVLNTCLWNSNLTSDIGELTHDLSIKQIDMTLFGALIPTKHLVKENFNPEIKFYQHYYFLNQITNKEIDVIGVPKLTSYVYFDLTYSDVPNDEKVNYFKMAREIPEETNNNNELLVEEGASAVKA